MATIASLSDCVIVQAGIYLHKNAAPSWYKARQLAQHAYGKDLYITYPYGGRRSLLQQWEMWWNRSTSTTGKVAFPGTSVHGGGMCVDVSNYREFSTEQLDAAMNAAGFYRNIPGEPWHYEKLTGGSGGNPPPPIEEEEDMSYGVLYYVISGASGSPELYLTGRGEGDSREWPTYNDQWFFQAEPQGPLTWVRFTGLPSLLAKKYPVVTRTGAQLRDMEIKTYGHIPNPGDPIRYR